MLNRVGRYEGEVVALVAAETEEAAERARNLVKIKWKPREPLMDFTHALESDILVHGDHLDEMYIQPNLAESYRPERNQYTGVCGNTEMPMPCWPGAIM